MVLVLLTSSRLLLAASAADPPAPASGAGGPSLQSRLKALSFKLAYECYVDGNWEIFVSNADGSQPHNLTQTPKVHEHYPQVSPDGTRICFSVDEGEGREAVRSLWVIGRASCRERV